MTTHDDFISFFQESRKIIADYFNARLEAYRLMAIKAFSKSAGYMLWIIISLGMLLILAVFGGITTGFYLSNLFGSYTKGFGATTLLILVLIILIALLRRPLFINPIIRALIHHHGKEEGDKINKN